MGSQLPAGQQAVSFVVDEESGVRSGATILVNGAKDVYVERAGVLEETRIAFKDNAHLMHIIDKIVSAVGRRVDESSPMVDARLADGSRVNVVIPPLAIDGPHLSIRRFGHIPISEEDLLANKALTQPMLELLRGAVQSRLNIVVSGGTGAGTTGIRLEDGTLVSTTDDGDGTIILAVYPWDVTISTARPDDSAMNVIAGVISAVTELGNRARVTVGPLTAEITVDSLRRLGLQPGQQAFASFKATGTRVVASQPATQGGTR